MYTPSEESSQEESSQDVDSNDDKAQKKKPLGKGKSGLTYGRKIEENNEETWEESMCQLQRKW